MAAGERASLSRRRGSGGPTPVTGFWSLTLYNEHHFFHPNQLGRYSLGTKNQHLRPGQDGSLILYVQQHPSGDDRHDNWLPAPAATSRCTCAPTWPQDAVTDRTWTPRPSPLPTTKSPRQ